MNVSTTVIERPAVSVESLRRLLTAPTVAAVHLLGVQSTDLRASLPALCRLVASVALGYKVQVGHAMGCPTVRAGTIDRCTCSAVNVEVRRQ